MKNRKLPALLLVGSIVGIGVGYILSNAYSLGICGVSLLCIDVMNAGHALFYGMFALATIFIVLLFLPKAFPAWGRFAIWSVPLAAILLAGYPEPTSWDILPEPENFSKFMAAFYVVLSLIIITVSSLRKKHT